MSMSVIIILLFVFINMITARNILTVSPSCDSHSDHTQLGRCLRPWIDLWERVRVRESHATDLLFPVPYYSRDTVLILCDRYVQTRDECLVPDNVLETCAEDQMLVFVKSHMDYFCGQRAVLALSEFECLNRTLALAKHCRRFIEGIPLPTHQEGKCRGLPRFFACVEPTLRIGCGDSGISVLIDAIEAFGCQLEKAVIDESAKIVQRLNSTGIYTPSSAKEFISKEKPKQLAAELLIPAPAASIAMTSSMALSTIGDCDPHKMGQLAQCYAPLMTHWDEIHSRQQSGKMTEVRFPLFNYSTKDVLRLCELYRVTLEDCLTTTLLQSCAGHDLIEFVDQQLGTVCSHIDETNFTTSFECTRSVSADNQRCFQWINGRPLPTMSIDQRCEGMSAFYDCLELEINDRCGTKALAQFAQAVSDLGCSAGQVLARKKQDIRVENDQPSELMSLMGNKREEKKEEDRSRAVEILDGELFVYNVSLDCEPKMRERARTCVAPLIKIWTSFRTLRPQLTEVSFPLYKYHRVELLELCDGYANVFLCSGFDPIMKCLNDELIRFARDHLGYVCSPQNIERFMRHYDCIMELEQSSECNRFVKGIAEPGHDENKCRGVSQYHECLRPMIESRCNTGALAEFQESISEFGCRLTAL